MILAADTCTFQPETITGDQMHLPFIIAMTAALTLSGGPPVHAETTRTVTVVTPIINDEAALQGAVADWNLNGTLLVMAAQCPPQGQCVIISFTTVRTSTEPAVGLTNPWGDPETITYDATYWNQPRKHVVAYHQALLCHELGHVLGLGHTDLGCMVPRPSWRQRFAGTGNRVMVPQVRPPQGILVGDVHGQYK